MKHKNLHTVFILFAFLLNGYTGIHAQALVAEQSIDILDSNLRQSNAVVLGQVTMNIPSSGVVVVHFDGLCIADSGDRIVLAASNTNNWGVNDGSIGVEVANNASGRESFSHTRAYNVTAGSSTFYAVGQNYVDESGSGIASVYGTLTAEFFPSLGDILVADTGFGFSGNVRGASTPVTRLTLNIPSPGQVVVHFDGFVISDTGDIITLAASNSTQWTVNQNVDFMATSPAINMSPFSHTQAYSITQAGLDTFYAVAQNYVITRGTGNITIYGNLTAEFFPYGGLESLDFGIVNQTEINVRQSSPVVLVTDTIAAGSTGTVLVTFDGLAYSDPGDRIVLAATDNSNWGTDDGNVAVIAPYAAPLNTNLFSHSRAYGVSAGSRTFEAVCQNYVNESGSGIASIYGDLTVKFYPGGALGIPEVKAAEDFNLFPNPASNQLTIVRTATGSNGDLLQISDITGQIIRTLNFGVASQTTVDVSTLAAGMYFVNINGAVKLFTKQ